MHKHSRKALTLVELIISMAIASVIGLTVLLSLSVLDRRNLESAARNLVSNLSWAREMALSKRDTSYIPIDYLITFDLANNSYAIYEDVDHDSVADAGEKKTEIPLRPVDLTSVTDFSAAAISPVMLVFSGSEVLNSAGALQNALITFTSVGKTKVVRVFSRTAYMRLDQ